jgi:hypothetical protein
MRFDPLSMLFGAFAIVLFGVILREMLGDATLGPTTTRMLYRLRTWLPAPSGALPEDRGESVRRLLKHLQRRSIAELAEGDAAVIVGTVRALPGVALLRSPVSNTECLGFHVDVRSGELDTFLRFRQLQEIAQMVDIAVDDETGTVQVRAEGLELAITDGPIGRWHPPLPPPIAALVPTRFHGHPVTVEEGLLQPGAKILVCGVVMHERSATGYRDGGTVLVLRATQTFPLVASTDPDLLVPGERPIEPGELHRRN